MALKSQPGEAITGRHPGQQDTRILDLREKPARQPWNQSKVPLPLSKRLAACSGVSVLRETQPALCVRPPAPSTPRTPDCEGQPSCLGLYPWVQIPPPCSLSLLGSGRPQSARQRTHTQVQQPRASWLSSACPDPSPCTQPSPPHGNRSWGSLVHPPGAQENQRGPEGRERRRHPSGQPLLAHPWHLVGHQHPVRGREKQVSEGQAK